MGIIRNNMFNTLVWDSIVSECLVDYGLVSLVGRFFVLRVVFVFFRYF